jgi:hypothetical protein
VLMAMIAILILMVREISTVRRIVISTEQQWRFKIIRSSATVENISLT